MNKVYLWKNTKTGEVVEHDHWSTPPKIKGTSKKDFVRVFNVAVGKVEGGGGSPARSS